MRILRPGSISKVVRIFVETRFGIVLLRPPLTSASILILPLNKASSLITRGSAELFFIVTLPPNSLPYGNSFPRILSWTENIFSGGVNTGTSVRPKTFSNIVKTALGSMGGVYFSPCWARISLARSAANDPGSLMIAAFRVSIAESFCPSAN
ncbi:hypothetical protein ES703_89891 [subsurface metagenome]